MNPAPAAPKAAFTFQQLLDTLFVTTWPWWVAGLLLGLAVLAYLWFFGHRLGFSSAYADTCKSIDRKVASTHPGVKTGRFWLVLGLPLGAFLATVGWWSWGWSMGRMDQIANGSFVVKAVLLVVGGLFIGFGARWVGGCTTNHVFSGVPSGDKASLAATASFLLAGYLLATILYKVL